MKINCCKYTGCAECLTASTCKTCKGGYYLSGTACLTCSTPNCHTCSGNVCSKCNQAASYSILPDRTCTQCQTTNGYYINVVSDINYCLTCSTSNCKVCPSNTCTKCDQANNYYLYADNNCYTGCSTTNGYYVLNSGGVLKCLACSTSNCLECTNNQCSKCNQASGYYLYPDKTCLAACDTNNGWYVDNSGSI